MCICVCICVYVCCVCVCAHTTPHTHTHTHAHIIVFMHLEASAPLLLPSCPPGGEYDGREVRCSHGAFAAKLADGGCGLWRSRALSHCLYRSLCKITRVNTTHTHTHTRVNTQVPHTHTRQHEKLRLHKYHWRDTRWGPMKVGGGRWGYIEVD